MAEGPFVPIDIACQDNLKRNQRFDQEEFWHLNKSQVEIFMLMVREGSIHIASQRLGIVPSLITTSVCALENELGFNLITRGRNIRKVTLTEKGALFTGLLQNY